MSFCTIYVCVHVQTLLISFDPSLTHGVCVLGSLLSLHSENFSFVVYKWSITKLWLQVFFFFFLLVFLQMRIKSGRENGEKDIDTWLSPSDM